MMACFLLTLSKTVPPEIELLMSNLANYNSQPTSLTSVHEAVQQVHRVPFIFLILRLRHMSS